MLEAIKALMLTSRLQIAMQTHGNVMRGLHHKSRRWSRHGGISMSSMAAGFVEIRLCEGTGSRVAVVVRLEAQIRMQVHVIGVRKGAVPIRVEFCTRECKLGESLAPRDWNMASKLAEVALQPKVSQGT